MGQSEIQSKGSAFYQRFIITDYPSLIKNNNLFLLHERLTSKKYLLTIKTYNDLDERLILQNQICKKLAFPHPNIISIEHYHFEQQRNSLCWRENKCFMVFDLKQAITLKHKLLINHFEQRLFNEIEILNGIFCIIKGIAYLSNHQHHGKLNTETIYVHNSSFYLSDPWMIPQRNQCKEYASPQELSNENVDEYASDLFKLAIIGLECLYRDVDSIYERNTINKQLLISYVNKCQNQSLKELLNIMVGNVKERRQLLNMVINKTIKSTNQMIKISSKNINQKIHQLIQRINRQHIINGNINQQHIIYHKSHPQAKQPIIKLLKYPLTKVQSSWNMLNVKTPFLKPIQKNVIFQQKLPKNKSTANLKELQRAKLNNHISQYKNNVKTAESFRCHTESHYDENSRLKTIEAQVKQTNLKLMNSLYQPSNKCVNLYQFNHHQNKHQNEIKMGNNQINKQILIAKNNHQMNRNYFRQNYNEKEDINFYNGIINHQIKNASSQLSSIHQQLKLNQQSNLNVQRKSINVKSTIDWIQKNDSLNNNRNLMDFVRFSKHNLEKIDDIAFRQSLNSNIEHRDSSVGSVQEKLCEYLTLQQKEQYLNIKQMQRPTEQHYQIQQNDQRSQIESMSFRLDSKNHTIPQQSYESQSSAKQLLAYYVQEYYENGNHYKGFKSNGKRNGEGIFYYADGGYYQGKWKDNMMNGLGRLYYNTGKLAYEGLWYNDQFHGRGKVFNDNPSISQVEYNYKDLKGIQNYWESYQGKAIAIIGDLIHDSKQGYGKILLSNGQSYEGFWRNDKINGKGIYRTKSGQVVRGIWVDQKLVQYL